MKLTLPLPPSTNALSRALVKGARAVVVSSRAYRNWRKDAEAWLTTQRSELLTGDVHVSMDIYYKDLRRDADSAIKPTLDILQGWCYDNDRQVWKIQASRHIDKDNPRVEVTVEPL